MATFQYLAGYLDILDNEFDRTTIAPVATTGSLARYQDAWGAGGEVTGSGFKEYVNGVPLAGVATGFFLFGQGGLPLLDVTGLAVSARDLIEDFATNSSTRWVLQGDDRLLGSAEMDLLMGYGGRDIVQGGAGDDVIIASNGADRLTGEAGADRFVFEANRGTDVITDFTDTGGAGDDVIHLSRASYRAMTVTQAGDDVLLTFGTSGALRLLDMTVAEIGRDDFSFASPL